MLHLKTITRLPELSFPAEFPFTVPIIQQFTALEFTREVTFFVGENGSGKSTLLETIAAAARLPTVGSEDVGQDETLQALRRLAERLRWSWTKKTQRGFFMRSEDFFGFAKRIARIKQELKNELDETQVNYRGRSKLAQGLASLPYRRELHALETSYGAGLDAQLHGESYFKLFQARFVPDGLYLLDEPEAPLSPQRQLAFMAMLHGMVKQGAQFIIATHSPILLAYPHAAIWSFADGQLTSSTYETLEHVTITRDFLNQPAVYLKHLLAEDNDEQRTRD